MEDFWRYIQQLAAYFYVDDVLLLSTCVARLPSMFNVLMDLFDQVFLHTNLVETVSMSCQPCCSIGEHSAKAYGLWVRV